MKYGVKFYRQTDNPDNAPLDCVAITVAYEEGDLKTETILIQEGYSRMTAAALEAYNAEHQAEYDAWLKVNGLSQLKQEVKDAIDIKTGALITAGFMYSLAEQTFRVRCSDEDQRNYTGLVISKDLLPYSGDSRIVLKGYTDDGSPVFVPFADASEVLAFYMAGVAHVNNCLTDGWKLKELGGTLSSGTVVAAVNTMTYDELIAFVDPRD